jgi:predicted DNA-binding protein
MSLDKKSTHVRLSPENHERAKALAEIKGKDLAQYLAYLLEKKLRVSGMYLIYKQKPLSAWEYQLCCGI